MSGSANSSSSKPQLNPQEILDLYTKQMPNVLGVTTGQSGVAANNIANAAAGANPIYTQSGLEQLQQLAPGYAQAGNNIAQINAGGQADLLAGEGGRAAQNADALSKSINPDYYNTRTNLSNSANQYLNSFNGGLMNGGEMAAAERAINQGNSATGNLGNTSPYSTVANALNFGQYARQKQQNFGNAIGTVTGTLPALQNTEFNPVGVALGAGNSSNNFALGQFNPTQGNAAAGAATDFGSNLLGAVTSAGNTQRSFSSGASGGVSCCFIFLEAYDGVLPEHVRYCRDKYYRAFPQIATGYKRMAKWLVPLMQKSDMVANLVRKWMVQPLTQYGLFVTRQSPDAKQYKSYRKFWFTIWNILGK